MTSLTKPKSTVNKEPVLVAEETVDQVKKVTVIIFNGPPGAGKDTLVDALCADPDLKVSKCTFKEPLFKIAIPLSGMTEEAFMTKYNNRENKEVAWDELNGMTPRAFLIKISEEWIKPSLGISRLGYLALQAVKVAPTDIILFSDGGFAEEVKLMQDIFGADSIILVRLYREGCTFEGDSRNYVEPGDSICLDLKLQDGQANMAVKALKRFITIN